MYVNVSYIAIGIDHEKAKAWAGGSGQVRLMLHDLPEWLKNRPGTLVVSIENMSNGMVPANSIVCAAIENAEGQVVLGVRHFDHIMHQQMQRGGDWTGAVEGFMDKNFCFRDRRTAWDIARAAGQIARRVGGDDKDGGTLYSENLY